MSNSAASPKANVSLWIRIRLLLRDARTEMKQNGLKGLIRRYGWKLFVAFFAYYLVRDLTLYIFIPWLIARHLITN